jgi:hypothetical protein
MIDPLLRTSGCSSDDGDSSVFLWKWLDSGCPAESQQNTLFRKIIHQVPGLFKAFYGESAGIRIFSFSAGK